MRVLLATTNAGKVREIQPLLATSGVEVVTLTQLGLRSSPDESGRTFWENARLKALFYASESGLIAIAEDSGLEIAGLGGEPGVDSARFLGPEASYSVRFAEIERRLATLPEAGRQARFVTAIAIASGDEILFETEAQIDGEVTATPAGDQGFGYDPIFSYPPFGKTTAQLTPDEKAAVSHRGRAFRDCVRWLHMRPQRTWH